MDLKLQIELEDVIICEQFGLIHQLQTHSVTYP